MAGLQGILYVCFVFPHMFFWYVCLLICLMNVVLVRDAGLMPWGQQNLLFGPRHAIPLLHNHVSSL